MQREKALQERLELEEAHAEEEAAEESEAVPATAEQDIVIVNTTLPSDASSSVPVVSQHDEVEDTPSANTRAQHKLRTLQDEVNVNLEATMIVIEALLLPFPTSPCNKIRRRRCSH